jgi:uncharacterized integral membrane protein
MILFALCLVLMSAAVVFALQNGFYTEVTFLVWQIEQPLALFLLAAFLAGFGAMLMLSLYFSIKHAQAIYALKAQIKKLEEKSDDSIVYKSPGLGAEGETTI